MPAKKSAPATANITQDAPKIRFQLIRNVMIHDFSPWMGGVHLIVPCEMKEDRAVVKPTGVDEYGGMVEKTRFISPVHPHFNMEKVFEIELEQTNPQPIEREPGYSDAFYDRLLDEEMTRAVEARERGEKLRRVFRHHIKEGNIKVVEDESGFLNTKPRYSDAQYRVIHELEVDREFQRRTGK
jgi:hypothetical protein